MGAPTPLSANLVGAFSLAAGGLLLKDLEDSWSSSRTGWVSPSIYPAFPPLLITIGSEIPLFLVFVLGAFLSYSRQKHYATASFTGLAVLTRPDGLIVAFLLATHHVFDKKRPVPWKAVLFFLILVLPWVVFAWAYFGSPIPVTLAAKQAQAALPVSQDYLAGLASNLYDFSNIWPIFWLALPIAILGLYDAVCCSHQWLLVFAWGFLHSLIYWLLGVSSYFWYYAPLGVAFIAAMGLGFAAIWNWQRRIASVIALALLFGSIYSLVDLSRNGDPRLPIYRAAGEWLYDNTPKEASVGALEVGIIGYYAQRPMIDFAGLLQPEIAGHLRLSETYQENANWVIEQYQPDYVVLHEAWSEELNREYLTDHCKVMQSFSNPKDRQKVIVYSCESIY